MKITAIILAGGRGKRMNGRDKGLQYWHGKTLIEWSIELIAPQVQDLVISCNRHQSIYRQFGFPVVTDQWQGFEGPIAGILSGAKQTQASALLVCPCDCPKLPKNLISKLTRPLLTGQSQAAIAASDGRRQPLLVLIKRELIDSLADFFEKQGRAMQDWLEKLIQENQAVEINFSTEVRSFINLNSFSDFSTRATTKNGRAFQSKGLPPNA